MTNNALSEIQSEDVHIPENDDMMLAYLDTMAADRLRDLPQLRQMLNLRFEASDKSLTALNELLERFRVEMGEVIGKDDPKPNADDGNMLAIDPNLTYGIGRMASKGVLGFFAGIFSGLSSASTETSSTQKPQPVLRENQVKPKVEEFITLFLKAIQDLDNNIKPVAEMKHRLQEMAQKMEGDSRVMQAYLHANPHSALKKRIERECSNVQSGLVGVQNELRNLQDQLGARIISSATLQTQLPFIATNLVSAAMASQGAAEIQQAQLTGDCVRRLNDSLAILSAKQTQRAVLGTIETAYSLPLDVSTMRRVRTIRDDTGVRATALVAEKELGRLSGLKEMQSLLATEQGPFTQSLLGHTSEQDKKY